VVVATDEAGLVDVVNFSVTLLSLIVTPLIDPPVMATLDASWLASVPVFGP